MQHHHYFFFKYIEYFTFVSAFFLFVCFNHSNALVANLQYKQGSMLRQMAAIADEAFRCIVQALLFPIQRIYIV